MWGWGVMVAVVVGGVVVVVVGQYNNDISDRQCTAHGQPGRPSTG